MKVECAVTEFLAELPGTGEQGSDAAGDVETQGKDVAGEVLIVGNVDEVRRGIDSDRGGRQQHQPPEHIREPRGITRVH